VRVRLRQLRLVFLFSRYSIAFRFISVILNDSVVSDVVLCIRRPSYRPPKVLCFRPVRLCVRTCLRTDVRTGVPGRHSPTGFQSTSSFFHTTTLLIIWFVMKTHFIIIARCYASAVLAMALCPSVSVTSRCSIETGERIELGFGV